MEIVCNCRIRVDGCRASWYGAELSTLLITCGKRLQVIDRVANILGEVIHSVDNLPYTPKRSEREEGREKGSQKRYIGSEPIEPETHIESHPVGPRGYRPSVCRRQADADGSIYREPIEHI